MESTITVTIPEDMESSLVRVARDEGIRTDEVAVKALKAYLFSKEFRTLRERLRAESDRIYTDEEVFELVS